MNPYILNIKAGFPTLDHPNNLHLPLFPKSGILQVFVPIHGNGWHVADLHCLSYYS
jgi:hypothetical protein